MCIAVGSKCSWLVQHLINLLQRNACQDCTSSNGFHLVGGCSAQQVQVHPFHHRKWFHCSGWKGLVDPCGCSGVYGPEMSVTNCDSKAHATINFGQQKVHCWVTIGESDPAVSRQLYGHGSGTSMPLPRSHTKHALRTASGLILISPGQQALGVLRRGKGVCAPVQVAYSLLKSQTHLLKGYKLVCNQADRNCWKQALQMAT